jgi:DNA-binding NarL/FixJ family response regulator
MGWLIGRERECDEIRAALARAAEGTASRRWLVGDPGCGKTTLCQWAAAEAEGFTRVRTTCVQDEETLPLSGALSVLRPLRHYGRHVPTGHRLTLVALLGGEPTPGLNASAVGAAVLAVLARAAEDGPVLVCIDDAHWLDEASRLALGFAFRRLDADAVAVIVASRLGAQSLGLESAAKTVAVSTLGHEDGPGPFALLTGAERQVAFAVADGLSNRDIAARLFISPKTVEHHLTHTYQKLNARSRTDLARLVLTKTTSAAAS